MKKLYLILLVGLLAVCANAQKMRVWSNGQIEYQKSINLIDSITFVGENTPDVDRNEGVEPELPIVVPTQDAVTLVIKFDEAPCDGYDVLFVGKYDDTNWEFVTAHKFEAIGDGWYKIVLKPGKADENSVVISGRPIQGKNGESDWKYDWSHKTEDIIALKGVGDGKIADSGYGEFNFAFNADDAADAAIVYVECKKWNIAPCTPANEYNLTIKTPAFCEEFEIELIGDFCGWADDATIKLGKGQTTYTVKVTATPNTAFKIRGQGSWDKEVWRYVDDPDSPEYDTWISVPTNYFGDDLNPVVDYSNPSKYKWNVCD